MPGQGAASLLGHTQSNTAHGLYTASGVQTGPAPAWRPHTCARVGSHGGTFGSRPGYIQHLAIRLPVSGRDTPLYTLYTPPPPVNNTHVIHHSHGIRGNDLFT